MKINIIIGKLLSAKVIICYSIILYVAFLFLSCKKNNDENAEVDKVLKKLQGKWAFLNFQANEHYSGVDHLNTISGSPGDYMDFGTNGKLYVRLQAFPDTSSFSLFSTSRIVIDGIDTFDLKTLNESQLILYRKNVYSSTDYYEQTYNLEK